MRLVYLYGPPASGKLTVATELAALTGFKLFHNHLTVSAAASVFEFGSPEFISVLHATRLHVFATAACAGIDMIFTNNSLWSGADGRTRFAAFAAEAERVVVEGGGLVLWVQLEPPRDVLLGRVASESRAALGKLVDPARLAANLESHDPEPLHQDDLRIDNSEVAPADAAQMVMRHYTLRVCD